MKPHSKALYENIVHDMAINLSSWELKAKLLADSGFVYSIYSDAFICSQELRHKLF